MFEFNTVKYFFSDEFALGPAIKDAKETAPYSRALVVTELFESGTQCKRKIIEGMLKEKGLIPNSF